MQVLVATYTVQVPYERLPFRTLGKLLDVSKSCSYPHRERVRREGEREDNLVTNPWRLHG